MTLRDLSRLHGDELTWALHEENRVRFARIETGQKFTWAIALILLAAYVSNFHVIADPTIHIPLPFWGWR
jgi:hypothetical protein